MLPSLLRRLVRALLGVWLVLGLASPVAASPAETRVRGLDATIAYCTQLVALSQPANHRANYDEAARNAVDSCVAAEGGVAAGEGFTTLYRTVAEGERAAIQSAGKYAPAAGGVEGKYFYPTAEQAANLAKANFPSQGVQTLTSVQVPNSLLGGAAKLHVSGEGSVIFFNGQQVQQLGSPNVWLHFPLP